MKITRADYKILCDSDVLIWSCEPCKNMLAKVCKYLEEIKNDLKIQKELVEKHENTLKNIEIIFESGKMNENMASEIKKVIREERTEKVPSFAEVLKINDPVVVVLPKDAEQESNVTKQLIKSKIDPVNHSVSGIRSAAKGAVVIECKNKEATKQLQKEAIEKLGDDYVVKLPEQRKPKIKIVNMREKLDEDLIVANIKRQNEHIKDDVEINVVKINEIVRGRYKDYSAIIETDSDTFSRILTKEKLSIGWDQCRVFEHVHVHRCYKCLGFNHSAKDCTSGVKCKYCSENHDEKDCKAEEEKCVNCVWAVKNLKLNLNVNHNAYSRDCAVFQNKIEFERKKINYTE